MRSLLASSLAAAAVFAAPALAQSAAVGTWTTVAETPQGSFEGTMIIAEDGGAHTVTFDDPPMPGAPPMESSVTDVVVGDSSFSFKRTLSTPQGPIELTYEGTVEGDTLTGTATSAFGPVSFTGTRK